MGLKEPLKQARAELLVELKHWKGFNATLLPVDPALAASCLRLALRSRQRRLAHAATKTLALFGEQLLWRVLLTFAATENAVFDTKLALAILVARRDRALVRRQGGLMRVAALLTEKLLRAPRSLAGIYLWRLAFEELNEVPHELRCFAVEARTRLMSYQTHSGPHDLADGLKSQTTGETGARLEALPFWIATTAMRQFDTPQALASALLQMQTAGHTDLSALLGRSTFCAGGRKVDSPSFLTKALIKDTPGGRKANRELITELPALRHALEDCGVSYDHHVDVVGEVLERIDEVCQESGSAFEANLGKASRWSNVLPTTKASAAQIGQIILENRGVADAIRFSHIPSSLMNFTGPEPTREKLDGNRTEEI
jgi:hypothetical protein